MNSTNIMGGIFFLFIILSGFWVSRSGKPYNALKFNIHKFIGLGLGVFLILTVFKANQSSPLNSGQIISVVVTFLLFLFSVIAGGILNVIADDGLKNITQTTEKALTLIHKFIPSLIMLSTGLTLFLVLSTS